MATLRIEFYDRVLPLDDHARDPINTITLSVGNKPTLPYLQPVAPSNNSGEVIAVLYAIDGPVYVDVGPTPDPTVNRTLINKGTQIAINISPGDNIAAVAAFDIPQQADSVIGPITGAIAGNVDEDLPIGRLFGINCTIPGNVKLRFVDGSEMLFPVYIGFQSYPLAVLRVLSAGTTATASYIILL